MPRLSGKYAFDEVDWVKRDYAIQKLSSMGDVYAHIFDIRSDKGYVTEESRDNAFGKATRFKEHLKPITAWICELKDSEGYLVTINSSCKPEQLLEKLKEWESMNGKQRRLI